MSEAEQHQRARDFVLRSLTSAGIPAKSAPREMGSQLIAAGKAGRAVLIDVLVRAGPHRRGGGSNLGMHWMLGRTQAEYVALVDLARERGWLARVDEFRARAKDVAGVRSHLDWIVARLGNSRTRIAEESEFDDWAMEESVAKLAKSVRSTNRARRRTGALPSQNIGNRG